MIVTTYDVEEELVAGVVGGGIKGGAVAHLVVPFPVQVIGHHTHEIQVSVNTQKETRFRTQTYILKCKGKHGKRGQMCTRV